MEGYRKYRPNDGTKKDNCQYRVWALGSCLEDLGSLTGFWHSGFGLRVELLGLQPGRSYPVVCIF